MERLHHRETRAQIQAQQQEIFALREQKASALQFGLAAESELHDVENKLGTALRSLEALQAEVLHAREAEGRAFSQLNTALNQLRNIQTVKTDTNYSSLQS